MQAPQALGLDTVTLKELFTAFADFADEDTMNVAAFVSCMQRMGVGIPALSERMFHVFDKGSSGRLDFRSFATGLSIVCNDAPAADRLELTFGLLSCNSATGIISAVELQSLTREFLWAGMDVVQGLMRTISEVFVQVTHGEVACPDESLDARRAVESEGANQAGKVAVAIMQEALSAAGLFGRELGDGEGLGRDEFRRWAVAQPRLITWLAHLGTQWRATMAEQATDVARAAAATAAAQIGNEGAPVGAEVDIDAVRHVVFGLGNWPNHTSQTLDESQFAIRLRELGMKNEALCEHLFCAFDMDRSGFVSPNEFAVGLARMSGSAAEQLELAWRMIDLDQDEKISREEFGRFIASFSALGLAHVQRHIDLFHDIFGSAGGSHGTFGDIVWSAAHKRMDSHTNRVVDHVFSFTVSSASSDVVGIDEFKAWYQQTPAFSAWLGRTGTTLAAAIAQLRASPEVDRSRRDVNEQLDTRMRADAAEMQ